MAESLHFYLDTLFGLLLGASIINLLLWLKTSQEFKRLILEGKTHPQTKAGEPSAERRRYHYIREISGGMPLIRYLIKGDFTKIEHTPLRGLAVRMRTILILQVLVSVPLFAIFLELKDSAHRRDIGPDIVSQAYGLYGQGKYEEAEKLLDGLLRDDPDNPDGHYYRAFVLEKLGRYQEALEDFMAASEAKPDHFDIFMHIDYLLTRRHQWRKVVQSWNTYIENRPSDARAYLERGGAYWQLGKVEEALKDAQKACDLGNEKGCARYQQAKRRLEGI